MPTWGVSRCTSSVGCGRSSASPQRVLHPFGGLAEIGDSVDLNATTTPTYVGDAHDLEALGIEDDSYDLVVLDPPYSDEESEWLYGTGPLRWNVFVEEAVRVTKPGGHVAVYHVKQPPRPEGTRLVRRIVILTRTWHAARVCFVFEKLAPDLTLFETLTGSRPKQAA
jgi:SAM-dependent methyltransferase